ncbi:MAG TPA: FtsQ-type POTRA domain-containing protein, partial [Candidatus Atribacteria bacterium]|nr:FtsQ-type POTRA domain-containing protein [Candidatus Atribacteria bacterium]
MKGHGTRLGILMILILLVCITAIVILGTDTFSIKKITVSGSNAADTNVIINTSNISYGDNIFKINRALVKQRIENSPPYPIVLSILLKLPDEVEIKVQERTPAAIVPYLSSNILIDKTGFIIDIRKQQEEAGSPSVEGVIIQSFTKGYKLKLIESESFKLRVLLNLLESIYKLEVNDIL